MKIIAKIAAAKLAIKNTKIKKEGKNTFSNYEYFTPSQIEFLVQQACSEQKLLTTFDLIRNDLGVYGVLTVYDLESDEHLKYQMATAIPEIKATNISQQLGGCMTYTERYLKTSAFGITDNNLDFDSHKPETKTAEPTQAIDFIAWNDQLKNCKSMEDLLNLSKQNAEAIKNPSIKALFTKRKLELDGK